MNEIDRPVTPGELHEKINTFRDTVHRVSEIPEGQLTYNDVVDVLFCGADYAYTRLKSVQNTPVWAEWHNGIDNFEEKQRMYERESIRWMGAYLSATGQALDGIEVGDTMLEFLSNMRDREMGRNENLSHVYDKMYIVSLRHISLCHTFNEPIFHVSEDFK